MRWEKCELWRSSLINAAPSSEPVFSLLLHMFPPVTWPIPKTTFTFNVSVAITQHKPHFSALLLKQLIFLSQLNEQGNMGALYKQTPTRAFQYDTCVYMYMLYWIGFKTSHNGQFGQCIQNLHPPYISIHPCILPSVRTYKHTYIHTYVGT